MYQSPGEFSCSFTGDQGWKVCMRCKRTWWMVVVSDVKSSLESIPTNFLKCCTAKKFWFPTSRGREVLGSNAGHQTWILRCLNVPHQLKTNTAEKFSLSLYSH